MADTPIPNHKEEEKKLIVLDQKELEELRRMLREAQHEAAQPDPAFVEKVVKEANGGRKVDPDKQYLVLSTGRWREIEERWRQTAIVPAEPEKPKAPSNVPYLATIVIMIAIAVSGILYYLSIRPEENIIVVAGVMFAVITPITTSIMAFMQSRDTNKAVNSRLEAFIASERKAEFAKGKDQGRSDAEDRADVLATQ